MKTMPDRLRLALVVLLAAAAPPGLAVDDDTCLSCHSSKDALSDAGPRAANLVVDANSLKGSIHEGFSCTQCHADLAAADAPIPHPTQLKPVDCGQCHGEIAATLNKVSIHARRMKTQEGARSPCSTCHGSHQIRPPADPESATNRHRLADTCAKCHAGTEAVPHNVVAEWKNSIHGRSVLAYELSDAPTCAACHKPHEIRPVSDPADPLNRRNRSNVCGTCHPSELKALLRGVHGKAWEAGNLAAPVCTDCHGAHDIQRPRDRESRVYAAQVSTTCGKCHGDPDLTTRFGLRPDRVSTYENSFHGKGTRWSNASVANCSSCHRYHDVRAGTDPASPVFASNLRATCGRPDCHPGATPSFAQLPVHAGAAGPNQALLRLFRVSYVLIITLTLAFMAVHQFLDLRKALGDARRRRGEHAHEEPKGSGLVATPRVEPLSRLVQRDGRWAIQRWTPNMVVQHLLLAISFTVLSVTGFLLELPASYAGRLGTFGPGLFELRSILHRIAAVLMIGTALYHGYWLVATHRGRRELVEMLPQPLHDLRHMILSFGWFLGVVDDQPPGRRYTYREKLEYWALVWGTIVMVGTGIVLWSASTWPWLVVELSRIVHSYEAVLAFMAILIWHMFGVQLRPGIEGTHPTWINGTITPHLMQEEHAEEYRDMVAWHGMDPAAEQTAWGRETRP